MFVPCESYIHKCAKEVLKSWLDDTPLKTTKKHFDLFEYTPDRESGVFLEYPIVKNLNYSSLSYNWDMLEMDKNSSWKNEFIPTYEECVNKFNKKPIAVCDVVISSENKPKYFIEIKHKSPVSEIKLNKLKRLGIENLIEIDAYWILSQIAKPKKLLYKKLI